VLQTSSTPGEKGVSASRHALTKRNSIFAQNAFYSHCVDLAAVHNDVSFRVAKVDVGKNITLRRKLRAA
jgi:hypothetical protein